MVTETSRGELDEPVTGATDVRLPVLAFAFLGAPVAWSVHFLLIYFVVALYCTAGRADAGPAIVVATVPLLAVSVASGLVASRKWRTRRESGDWERTLAEPGGRTPFFLVMGMLGAALFTALIVAETIPILFVPTCSPGSA